TLYCFPSTKFANPHGLLLPVTSNTPPLLSAISFQASLNSCRWLHLTRSTRPPRVAPGTLPISPAISTYTPIGGGKGGSTRRQGRRVGESAWRGAGIEVR